MNIKEARIGNYLHHKKYGDVIVEPQDFKDWSWNDVDGKNMTEDILLKAGFEFENQKGDEKYYRHKENKDYGVIIADGACDFCEVDCEFNSDDTTWKMIADFYYQNQLQNIWFDVTHNELIFI